MKTKTAASFPRLLADVGGTRARFASQLEPLGPLSHCRRAHSASFSDRRRRPQWARTVGLVEGPNAPSEQRGDALTDAGDHGASAQPARKSRHRHPASHALMTARAVVTSMRSIRTRPGPKAIVHAGMAKR